MHSEERYMMRCLDLAEQGKSSVFSNPMVGAVIVHEDKIIGEGFHQEYGLEHAEVMAIKSVQDPALLKYSTLYVNLEPCSHFGKTPPCADLIIDSGIPKVVIGMNDPNPIVAGRGIQKLKNAGVELLLNVALEQSKSLNKKFNHLFSKGMPYITLKWAQTADGIIGRALKDQNKSKQISNDEASVFVHKLRAENNVILIGSRTANLDKPALNVRHYAGFNPVKVILSPGDTVSQDLDLFKSGNTIIYTLGESYESDGLEKVQIQREDFIIHAMKDLAKRGFHSVLVEGGAQIIQAFIDHELWQEVFIIESDQQWHTGIAAPKLSLEPGKLRKLGTNTLKQFFNGQ